MGGRQHWVVTLEGGTLSLTSPEPTSADPWSRHFAPAFEVIASASIEVQQAVGANRYRGRSHSLWYCDAVDVGAFDWYETAFMFNPIGRGGSPATEPFALAPGEASGKAVAPVVAEHQVAWPFTVVKAEEQDFVNRWTSWFAEAAQWRLSHPRRMPEREVQGSWRN